MSGYDSTGLLDIALGFLELWAFFFFTYSLTLVIYLTLALAPFSSHELKVKQNKTQGHTMHF